MRRKVAIRKLNRTLLKKAGTKEIYITNVDLMRLFDYTSIDQLATSRTDAQSKKLFRVKDEQGNQLPDLVLSVTRENNEVRLTGFGDFFKQNNISETGTITLECYEIGATKEYMLSFCRNANIRVLKAYETSDNLANYQVTNTNGRISISELEQAVENYENTYWLWDDSFNENRWVELTSKELDVVCLQNNISERKTLKIEALEDSFKKILKAKSTSSNRVIYQVKKLYKIRELVNEEWVDADLHGIKLVELKDENQRIVLMDREENSFRYFEGGSAI